MKDDRLPKTEGKTKINCRKRALALFLLALFLLLPAGCGKESSVRTLRDYDNKNPELPGFLTVEKGHFTTEEGKRVVLRGVNLGNWLLMETWMSFVREYTEDWGYYDTLEVWNQRFGPQKAEELVRAYEDVYITEEDLEQIGRLGFNCVRVPFWYRNFMKEDGSWLSEDPGENPGFCRLDWLLDECESLGIYVILDMHGAPGGQSKNHSTGKAGRNLLYEDEVLMERACSLWKAIAGRYRDRAVVAAYDLLNEPQNNGGYDGPASWPAESREAVENTNRAYDVLYHAVREADSRHIVSLEGIWSTEVLPNPGEMGYENVAYQLHLYDREPGMIRYRVKELTAVRKIWGAAALVGEFNNGPQEEYAVKQYAKNGISTVKWTYKTVNAGAQWGIFDRSLTPRLDIRTASFEETMEFIRNELPTRQFNFNAGEAEILL